MNITISKDYFDNSNWIIVDFSANQNQLDNDKITRLRALQKIKYNLAGGKSIPSAQIKHGNFIDSCTVYIENPTPEFEKDLMLWKLS